MADFRVTVEADELESSLAPTAEIDEGGVGADRHDGAGDAGAGIERGRRLYRCGRGEDRVDLDPLDGGLEILLEILLEAGTEIRNSDALRRREDIREG